LNGGDPTSHTPAHDTDATVAPFRAWRGLRLLIARGPAGPPQQSAALCTLFAKWQLMATVTGGKTIQNSTPIVVKGNY